MHVERGAWTTWHVAAYVTRVSSPGAILKKKAALLFTTTWSCRRSVPRNPARLRVSATIPSPPNAASACRSTDLRGVFLSRSLCSPDLPSTPGFTTEVAGLVEITGGPRPRGRWVPVAPVVLHSLTLSGVWYPRAFKLVKSVQVCPHVRGTLRRPRWATRSRLANARLAGR